MIWTSNGSAPLPWVLVLVCIFCIPADPNGYDKKTPKSSDFHKQSIQNQPTLSPRALRVLACRTQRACQNDTKIFRFSLTFHQNQPTWRPSALQKRCQERVGTGAEKRRAPEDENGGLRAPLGSFRAPFRTPTDPQVGPKITLLL